MAFRNMRKAPEPRMQLQPDALILLRKREPLHNGPLLDLETVPQAQETVRFQGRADLGRISRCYSESWSGILF
jgi:hypothetical protein